MRMDGQAWSAQSRVTTPSASKLHRPDARRLHGESPSPTSAARPRAGAEGNPPTTAAYVPAPGAVSAIRPKSPAGITAPPCGTIVNRTAD